MTGSDNVLRFAQIVADRLQRGLMGCHPPVAVAIGGNRLHFWGLALSVFAVSMVAVVIGGPRFRTLAQDTRDLELSNKGTGVVESGGLLSCAFDQQQGSAGKRKRK